MRALVRRVESRGYATVERLAAYFDTLRAGDESNAVIAAAGAVNLMTMHAAKGLEFPVVFLVNLHLPGRGRPAGFSVIEHGPDGQPDVAFATNDATRLEERREAEELRRLLYVAVTRARDRLYLSAELDRKGRLKRGARSLASLLPGGVADLFAAAGMAADGDDVIWQAGAERFAFRACRQGAAPPPAPPQPDASVPAPSAARRLGVPGRVAVSASTVVGEAGESNTTDRAAPRPRRAERDERLLGSLVHRLFQVRADPDAGAAALAAQARLLVRGPERVDIPDLDETIHEAVETYLVLRRRPDVEAVLASGVCYYEVSFSYDPPDRPDLRVRGMVDCLVLSPDGTATVLEFKTGRPRPAHDRQAAEYARAVGAALGISTVEGRVIYAGAVD
jgi:ATP-dependent helicase/nuclease subunit A